MGYDIVVEVEGPFLLMDEIGLKKGGYFCSAMILNDAKPIQLTKGPFA